MSEQHCVYCGRPLRCQAENPAAVSAGKDVREIRDGPVDVPAGDKYFCRQVCGYLWASQRVKRWVAAPSEMQSA